MNGCCVNILSDRSLCPNPFLAVEVHADGNVSVCCPSRLKEAYRYIGNVLDVSGINPLRRLWNSAEARSLRLAMYEGRQHESCEPYCPQLVALRAGKTPPWYSHLLDASVAEDMERSSETMSNPYRAVSVACDGSCNLACIMCRAERQPLPSETERRVSERVFDSILADIGDLGFLELTGNGDPFYNKRVQKFLDSLEGRDLSHLSLRFITNGQAVTAERLKSVAGLNLKELAVSVSIDAATRETYESIRRGGTWDRLVEVMELLANLRREGAIQRLAASFVVMKRNLDEMGPFVELGRAWGLDFIEFQRMHGTLAPRENIFEEKQSEKLDRLAEIIGQRPFDEPWINISPLLPNRSVNNSGGDK